MQSVSDVRGRNAPAYIGHIALYTMHRNYAALNYGNTVRRQSITRSVCGINTADMGSANSLFVVSFRHFYEKCLFKTVS